MAPLCCRGVAAATYQRQSEIKLYSLAVTSGDPFQNWLSRMNAGQVGIAWWIHERLREIVADIVRKLDGGSRGKNASAVAVLRPPLGYLVSRRTGRYALVPRFEAKRGVRASLVRAL